MGSVHTRKQIDVSTEHDLVVFRVGHAEEKYSYFRAANIAQDMKVAARMAMLFEGADPKTSADMLYGSDAQQEAMANSIKYVHNGARRSRAQPHYRSNVTFKGVEVRLRIGDTIIGMYWRDALTVSGWLRIRAKEAKRWAGDSSKRFRLVGILRDASQGH